MQLPISHHYLASFQIYYRFSAENSDLTPFDPNFRMFPWDQVADVGAPNIAKTLSWLFIYIFEVIQLIWPRYLNVTDGRTTYWSSVHHTVKNGKNQTVFDEIVTKKMVAELRCSSLSLCRHTSRDQISSIFTFIRSQPHYSALVGHQTDWYATYMWHVFYEVLQ